MAMTGVSEVMDGVERLVAGHREITDEPLLLAVYFEPERQPGDVFIFEVIDGLGSNRVGEDRTLFEISYPSSPNFDVPNGHRLHLVLTNPVELDVAAREGWAGLNEIRDAVRNGRATTVFEDPGRPELGRLLHA